MNFCLSFVMVNGSLAPILLTGSGFLRMPITQWNMPFKRAALRIAFLRAAHAMETGITAFQDG